jgi:hypothetical protein
MYRSKVRILTVVAAGALIATPSSLLTGCQNKGASHNPGKQRAATTNQNGAGSAKRPTDKKPMKAAQGQTKVEKYVVPEGMTPQDAKKEYNKLIRQLSRKDAEFMGLVSAKQAAHKKRQEAAMAAARKIDGGAELVSAIEAAQGEMQKVAMMHQAPPKTDEDRKRMMTERQAAQSKIRDAWEAYNEFQKNHPEIAEARKPFNEEAQTANQAINKELRKRGYGALMKKMWEK